MAHFPQLIKNAAEIWRFETVSYAQFQESRVGNQVTIKVRMQATDIMAEFVGEVHFGLDPKGLLFYHSEADFHKLDANYRVIYYDWDPNRTKEVTVQVDFFVPSGEGDGDLFARFLARVPRDYKLPTPSGALGNGNWKPFVAATAQTDIHKVTNARRVRLFFPSVRKQVSFNADGDQNKPGITDKGVFIFRDIANLKDVVDGKNVVADYAPTRIVFRPQGSTKVVALFLPDDQIKINLGGGVQPPATKWEAYDPNADTEAIRLLSGGGDA